MTDKEKAIVMAHTGICMLTGDKFQIFHKYIENVMGRPIMTHEIGFLADEIKEKTKADFIELCANESSLENPNKWIPVSERLPENDEVVLGTNSSNDLFQTYIWDDCGEIKWYADGCFDVPVVAWMPLPEPYKSEMESE